MSANQEIDGGARFGFGENWTRFLALLDEERIAMAENSLKDMLEVKDLRGRSFLDIGCGSGLFSLAARRLGATVHSFDFDPKSVACALELKRRYFANDDRWRIEEGSVLDRAYLARLGRFDVVYSWGVLHHTGAMWLAIENAITRVAYTGGKFYIAIYNDQGWKSHLWWFIKFIYNRLPRFLRPTLVFMTMSTARILVALKYTFKLQPKIALTSLFRGRRERGMSARYDDIDWIGGFPYEFVSFSVLRDYLQARGFELLNARPNASLGCSELALERVECAQ